MSSMYERDARSQHAPDDDLGAVTRSIARIVLRYRRTIDCVGESCQQCEDHHAPTIERFVRTAQPVQFVLPAFPTKSPSMHKVIGHLPDLADELGLRCLQQICDQIQAVYSPGAEINIAADGRVFNDVLGVPDHHVTAYQRELASMLDEHGLTSLRLFNLEDVIEGQTFAAMRATLMGRYGTSLEELRCQVRGGGEPLRLYRGITRFLFEDTRGGDPDMSNTALQNQARSNAYRVIQRSRAWGALIAQEYAGALRLSIHPQACSSRKLGILLGPTPDSWLTPWHCVAVATPVGFIFMKRRDAEALGARVAHDGERPTHYLLSDYQSDDGLLERLARFAEGVNDE